MKEPKHILKHHAFISIIKSVIRKIKKRPHIIMMSDQLPEKALYIANHNGAAGPMTIITFYPKILVPWGAFQMTKGYTSRWRYLYHVFYIQKLKYSKFKSFILATLFGIVSKALYQGVKLIPSYQDVRMRNTIELSLKHLEVNNSILIFPEDSSSGYQDEIETFHQGFIYLAQAYEKKHHEKLPIVPMYYNKQKNTLLIGKPETIDKKKTRHDLSEDFRVLLNRLGNES